MADSTPSTTDHHSVWLIVPLVFRIRSAVSSLIAIRPEMIVRLAQMLNAFDGCQVPGAVAQKMMKRLLQWQILVQETRVDTERVPAVKGALKASVNAKRTTTFDWKAGFANMETSPRPLEAVPVLDYCSERKQRSSRC